MVPLALSLALGTGQGAFRPRKWWEVFSHSIPGVKLRASVPHEVHDGR
jgi:hypothetical protein